VYFISIAYIGHPVWRSHPEEAKRGPPSGPRIPRNEGAMMSLLLPYATTGVSLIAGWCVIGATPRSQPRTPAMMLPHGCEGLRVRRMTALCTFRRPFMGRPVPRQFMRNAVLDVTTIVPATAYHRRSYAERYSRHREVDWCGDRRSELAVAQSCLDAPRPPKPTATPPGGRSWRRATLCSTLPATPGTLWGRLSSPRHDLRTISTCFASMLQMA
jgi:hypothetical protein